MLGNFVNFGNCSSSGISHAEKALLYRRDMEPEQYRAIVGQHMVPADDQKPYKILSSEDYVELPFLGFERNVGSVARLKGVDLTPYDHRNEVICENLFRVWPDAYILIIIREPLSWAVSKYDHWYRRDLIDETLKAVWIHLARAMIGLFIVILKSLVAITSASCRMNGFFGIPENF